MNKTHINELIRNMTKSGIVTKASPWLIEGLGEKALNVRYVGLRLDQDWQDILPAGNNILLKYILDKTTGSVECFLANTPPFTRLFREPLAQGVKWEHLLGEWKRKLRKDKEAYMHHTEAVDNLYARIVGKVKR